MFCDDQKFRYHQIVKGGKLQKSESSRICVVIAEGSTNNTIGLLLLLHWDPSFKANMGSQLIVVFYRSCPWPGGHLQGNK